MKKQTISMIPGKIESGADSLEKLPALLKATGKKVLLVHGHRPVEDGLLAKVRLLLNENDVDHANMGQILPNPKYDSVKRGIKIARKEKCDIILALGGGSTLQCAKAIALGAGYKGDVWDFWTGKKKPVHVLPVASVLTNPSSGAELSGGCTLVRKGKQKTVHFPQLVCTFSILDPKLSMYPFYPTMNQIFGLFEHLFFAYLEKEGEQQQIAMDLMKKLFRAASVLEENINDIDARNDLFEIGLQSHKQLGSVSIGLESLADHLAFACSLPEGSAASCLFDSWCDLCEDSQKEKIAALGPKLFGLESPDYKKTMEALEAQFKKMQLPLSISEAGLSVKDKNLNKLAENKTEKKILAHALKKEKEKSDKKDHTVAAD